MIERIARHHVTHQSNRHDPGSRQYDPIYRMIDQYGLKPDNHGNDRLYSRISELIPQTHI
jgi:hypothetical protein